MHRTHLTHFGFILMSMFAILFGTYVSTSSAQTACTSFPNVTVTGNTSGLVYGSGPYGATSDIGAAAVHAGLISVGETATIRRTFPQVRASLQGTTAHGVTSVAYALSMCTVVLEKVGATAADTTAQMQMITQLRALIQNLRAQMGSAGSGSTTGTNPFKKFTATTAPSPLAQYTRVTFTWDATGGTGVRIRCTGPYQDNLTGLRLTSVTSVGLGYPSTRTILGYRGGTQTMFINQFSSSYQGTKLQADKTLPLIGSVQINLTTSRYSYLGGKHTCEAEVVKDGVRVGSPANTAFVIGASAMSATPPSTVGTPVVEAPTLSTGRIPSPATPTPTVATSPAAGVTQVSKILRPIVREIVDYKSSIMTLEFLAGANGTVPYTIKNSSGTTLQSGSLSVNSGKNTSSLQLSSSVKDHRGGFLTLQIGGREVTFGVGLLFVVAGQSNTVNAECGYCVGYSVPSNSNVVYLRDPSPVRETYNGTSIPSTRSLSQKLTDGTLTFEALPETPSGVQGEAKNVWVRVGASLQSALNMPVGFIIVGVAGTAVSEWSEGALGSRLDIGAKFHPTAVLWHQGESDATVGTTKATYASRLRSLMTNTMGDIAAPWVVAQTSFCRYQEVEATLNTPDRAVMDIEQAQIDLIKQGGFSRAVYPGPNTNRIPHSCHFDRRAEYDALVAAWVSNLKGSGVISGATPNTQNIPVFTPRGLTDIHRFFNASYADHLLTTVKSEGTNASGYAYEGVGLTAFPIRSGTGEEQNLKTIYRCLNTTEGKHFVSEAQDCGGKTAEGALGKIFVAKPYSTLGSVIYMAKPLYQCRATGGASYRLTTPDRSECTAAGFNDIRELGWMPQDRI